MLWHSACEEALQWHSDFWRVACKDGVVGWSASDKCSFCNGKAAMAKIAIAMTKNVSAILKSEQ